MKINTITRIGNDERISWTIRLCLFCSSGNLKDQFIAALRTYFLSFLDCKRTKDNVQVIFLSLLRIDSLCLKSWISSITLFSIFFVACGGEINKKKASLVIATAANAQFAIKEIATLFEEKYHIPVRIIVGSSGKLTAQIQQGAPYDLLIAANLKYPEKLFKDGLAISPPKVYALGRLVLWTMNENIPLDAELSVLNQPTIQKIGIANPRNAPYGMEAVRVLQHLGRYDSIAHKLVYGESIAQVTQFVLTKNCEVGITAKSILQSPKMQNKGYWIDIPPTAYKPIRQGVIVTKHGEEQHPELVKKFFDFLFSPTAKRIFEKYSYQVAYERMRE